MARMVAIIVSFVLVAEAIYLNKRMINNDFSIMLVIFATTNLLMESAFHKGYIATRVLLPFYSFVVICFCELLSAILIKIKKENETAFIKSAGGVALLKILKTMICLSFIAITVIQTNFMYTKDWKDDYRFKKWVLGEKMTNSKYPEPSYWNAAEIFYQQKYKNIADDYLLEIYK